jgi:hypothetical protein
VPEFRDGLRKLGINGTIVEKDLWELESVEGSLGLIEIDAGPIRFVSIFAVQHRHGRDMYTGFIVPDMKIAALIEEYFADGASRYRASYSTDNYFEKNGAPMVERPVRINLERRLFRDPGWTGEDQGLGIIERINSDTLHDDKLLNSFGGLTISSDARHGRWVLSKLRPTPPSQEIWNNYIAIAQHLLATDYLIYGA